MQTFLAAVGFFAIVLFVLRQWDAFWSPIAGAVERLVHRGLVRLFPRLDDRYRRLIAGGVPMMRNGAPIDDAPQEVVVILPPNPEEQARDLERIRELEELPGHTSHERIELRELQAIYGLTPEPLPDPAKLERLRSLESEPALTSYEKEELAELRASLGHA